MKEVCNQYLDLSQNTPSHYHGKCAACGETFSSPQLPAGIDQVIKWFEAISAVHTIKGCNKMQLDLKRRIPKRELKK